MMPEVWCSLRVRPGKCGEVGQLRERDVHAERPRSAPPMAYALAKVLRQHRSVDQVLVQELWIHVRDDAARANSLAVLGDHADRAAGLDDHFAHGTGNANLDAALGRGPGHRLRDRAHAADRVAPRSLLAVDLAEHVVQQHVGGARRVRTRVVAHDAVEAVRRLDRSALEPRVEIISRRLDEQIEQLAPQRHVELCNSFAQASAAQQFGQSLQPGPVGDVRRSFEHEIAQHIGDPIEPGTIRREALGIARRELRHFLLGSSRADFQKLAGVQRQEIRQSPLDHAQTVARQVEVADDFRVEQRDGIGGHRIAEAGVELLGHGGAADDRSPLEHRDFEARRREIGGAHQAVVAAADDHRIARRGLSRSGREILHALRTSTLVSSNAC